MGGKSDTVSAIIVAWNSAGDIRRCLESLFSQTHPPSEVIVVDNDSRDGTAEIVAAEFPAARLIRAGKNLGFAKGNNLGFEASTGEWILFLNPDARLASDWTENLLRTAAINPRAGALGGILYRETDNSGESPLDSTGIEIYMSRRVRDRNAGDGADCAPQVPERVFGVCAAAALYRREALVETLVGGELFPESFFCYYEDADLAWRCWRRGWEAWVNPAAVGWHRRGGSPTGAKFSRYLTQRNRLWMILRNDRIGSLIGALIWLMLHELILLVRMIRYPYLFKAAFESLAGIPRALEERKGLATTNFEAPPFQRGVGFSAAERKSAIQRAENFSK